MFVVVFIVAFVVFALSPVITNYDSYSSFPAAVSLVNRHTLSLDAYRSVPTLVHNYTVTSNHGHLVTGYPWVVALFFIPTVLAIDLLHSIGGPSADHLVVANQMGPVQMETAALVSALACATLALLAFARLPGDQRRRYRLSLICGLLFAFGTSAWSLTSRAMWQQAPAFLLLALGLLQIDRSCRDTIRPQRHALLAGAFLALAVAVRPTEAVPLGVCFLFLSWKRRALLGAYIGGVTVVAIPWFVLTHLAFGSFLQSYDLVDHRTLQSAFFEAFAANLVSPARGIVVFSPLCLLAIPGIVLARRASRVDLLTAVSAVTVPLLLVVVSGFSAGWWGGNTYGPRLMSDTFPFLFVLALPVAPWCAEHLTAMRCASEPTSRRAAALVGCVAIAAVLSVAFNAEGGLLRSTTCWNGVPGTPGNVDKDPGRVWSWSDPQFLTGFRSLTTFSIRKSILSTCSRGTT